MIELNELQKTKILKCFLDKGFATHVIQDFLNKGIDHFVILYKKIVLSAVNNPVFLYEEYLNDLAIRDLLEYVMDSVPEKRNEISLAIKKLDQEFKQTLELTDKLIIAHDKEKEYPKRKFWWYYGYPKNVKWE